MRDFTLEYDAGAGQYSLDLVSRKPDAVVDAIVYGVATILDRDPTEIPPLAQVVDPDALDAVFRTGVERGAGLHISFEYSGVGVAVEEDGQIRFDPPD